ncbi:serine esterase (DUF676) protein [Besnoitia besnoiti]|uniref:Serine esterase (DUF676) protein n=1 Tax=Besnoitia besnoiti TaxID=94643 RepID=A0A2A9MNM5_BESBE|nr:serine esterase (DUF676) protein [Besnoitia besnoiti]PFH37320.1 serine esterase (DUF676) protein [Besnoitia besnoiti]
MEGVVPFAAASAFEPGEESVSNYFSLRAFTTASYRDEPEAAPASEPAAASPPRREASEESPDSAGEGKKDSQARKMSAQSLAAFFSLPDMPALSPSCLIPALTSLGLLGGSAAAADSDGSPRVASASPESGCAAVPAGRRSLLLHGLVENSVAAFLGRDELEQDVPPHAPPHAPPPVCLVVCVHGLGGIGSDFKFTAQVLNRRAPHIKVLVSSSNTGKTFDGVERGGARLAEEVRQEIARYPSLRYISLIGFSLGGLYMRYAVRLLYSPATGSAPPTVGGLRPLCVGTVASPHLGVRRFSYLPLPDALVRPLVSSYFRITSHFRAKNQISAPSSPFSRRSTPSSSSSFARGDSISSEEAEVARQTRLFCEQAFLEAREKERDAGERTTAADTTEVATATSARSDEGEGERRAEEKEDASDLRREPSNEETEIFQEVEALEEDAAGKGLGRLTEGDAKHEPAGSEGGFDWGRLSQLHESRTLADLMLFSEREYQRELNEIEKNMKNGKPLAWLWSRSAAGAEDKGHDGDKGDTRDADGASEGEVPQEDDEPLLVQMSKGVFVDSLKVFTHRRLYANARGDVLVPLGTAAIDPSLPSNPELQRILQQTRRSMIVGAGRVVMVSHPGTPPRFVSPSATCEEAWSSAALYNSDVSRPVFLSQQSTRYLSCAGSPLMRPGSSLSLSASAPHLALSSSCSPASSRASSRCASPRHNLLSPRQAGTLNGREAQREEGDGACEEEAFADCVAEEALTASADAGADLSHSRSSGSFSSASSLFASFRQGSSAAALNWREWLKLNTHGETEDEMATRLNEVQWTKVIVDFPTFVPVAHDSINASGKSRFRTWVTAGGRPIVEQLVDWLVSSLDDALAADRLKEGEPIASRREF